MRDWNRDNKRAARLLGLLQDDAVDYGAKEEIRAWFWSDVGGEAKKAAFIEQFGQIMPNPVPDETDRRKYAELAAVLKLNYNGRSAVRETRRANIFRSPVRVAAALVLLLGISCMTYLWMDRAANSAAELPIAQVMESAGSSARSIQLPDGSSVELQPNSALTYDEDFTSGRRVHLDGEALLTVGKSTNEAGEPIPFSVTTDDLKIDVYGTAFRVIDPSDDGDDRSIVALYDGTVSVAAGDSVVNLERGETYRYDHATREPNVALMLAREMVEHGFMPLLRFDESTLGNLVTSIAANHKVVFVLPEDVDLAKGKFSGDFQAEDLKSTLNILSKSSKGLNFTLAGDKVVVKRK